MMNSPEFKFYSLSLLILTVSVFVGILCHVFRGAVGQNEHFWGRGTFARDVLNGNVLEVHIFKLEYTDAGAWEFYSVRNLLFMIACTSIIPLLYILAYWTEKQTFISSVCGAIGPLRDAVFGCG